ncbi:MAG: LacI family DNA-binding transcriptional regulator [Treponema sp.]|jgi:LacI family transcriptional regulator|nr:LacI family DNA-binding transcriptional regulator [Treponema sp.]
MTLAEIAEKAETSLGTVDRVIHRRGNVSLAVRKRVEAVIAQYGYTPNLAARHLKRRSVLTLGLLFPEPGSGSGYGDAIIAGIHNAAETFKAFNITLVPGFFDRYAKGDMLAVGKSLLERGLDGMILAPVVSDDALALADAMREIPYVCVDTPPPGPPGTMSPMTSIAQNPYHSGQCAGRMMKLLRGSGRFVTIRMFDNAFNLRERIRGFTDYFAQDGSTQVVEAESPGYGSAALYDFLDDLFARCGETNGVFLPHAETHLIASYLVSRGIKSRVTLIGHDNLPLNRRALLDGAIDCLIDQRPENQGFQAMSQFYRKQILGEKCPPVIEMPIDIFFKENVISQVT